MKKESLSVGRPAHLRHTNALTILKLLREAGSCSRADLVRASGLSAPTITNVVNDLIAAKLVSPQGEGESSGGRPPDMLAFNAKRGCLMGVQLTARHLVFLMTDLMGKQLETATVPLTDQKTTPEAICQLIGTQVRTLLRKQKRSREQLLALVTAMPAIVNVDDGVVVAISTLQGWRKVRFHALMRKIVDCRVIVENDTNLAALGEQHRGAALFHENFVLVQIDANVSAGIVLGGRIHHGAQWAAGEIGYLRLPHVERKFPALHEFGELEQMLTSQAIVQGFHECKEAVAAGGAAKEVTDAARVLDLAHADDACAKKIAQSRAALAADIIVNLSLILNPGLILLGGAVGSHPEMVSLVRQQLQRAEFAVPEIAPATLGDAAALWGAISMALEALPGILLPQPRG